jgi:hypothetical protein
MAGNPEHDSNVKTALTGQFQELIVVTTNRCRSYNPSFVTRPLDLIIKQGQSHTLPFVYFALHGEWICYFPAGEEVGGGIH